MHLNSWAKVIAAKTETETNRLENVFIYFFLNYATWKTGWILAERVCVCVQN